MSDEKTNEQPNAPQVVNSTALLEVHRRFKHLDEILRAVAGSNDPMMRTLSELWEAIDDYVTSNTIVTGSEQPEKGLE